MRALLIVMLALMAAPLWAGKPPRDMREIESTEVFQLRPDKAYILFRTARKSRGAWINPVLLRVPSQSERDRYDEARKSEFPTLKAKLDKKRDALVKGGKVEQADALPDIATEPFNIQWDGLANLQWIKNKSVFYQNPTTDIYLVEVEPAEFVLYGASGSDTLHVCFCLGTVGFEAKAGEITDLGMFIADVAKTASTSPELASETNFGPSSDSMFFLLTATVRPSSDGSLIPDTLSGSKIEAANYHAVGKYFNPNTMMINRLVPVPGVLDYDRGKVLDVQTGAVVPDHF